MKQIDDAHYKYVESEWIESIYRESESVREREKSLLSIRVSNAHISWMC